MEVPRFEELIVKLVNVIQPIATRIMKPFTGKPHPEGMNIYEVEDDDSFDEVCRSGLAMPVCSANPLVRRHALAQAIKIEGGSYTTDKPEIQAIGREYGVTIHLTHTKKKNK